MILREIMRMGAMPTGCNLYFHRRKPVWNMAWNIIRANYSESREAVAA